MLRRANRPEALLTAAAVMFCVVVTGCSGDDTTTTVDPPATVASTVAASRSTVVTSEEGLDAIVATWVTLGFSEKQARCLVDKTNEMSSQLDSTSPDAISAGDRNLIDQIMSDCDIDDASLKGQLGG